MTQKFLILFFVFVAVGSFRAMAQEEPEDIGLATDEFQIAFYEALKQKGIENYDRAVSSLERCLELQPNNAVVLYELGKNYLKLRDYKRAYDVFEKAVTIEPQNKWYWVGLYDVAYQTRDYDHAITILDELIKRDPAFREDLVTLYMYTQDYEKALELIDELNETTGKSERRNQYRAQILSTTRFKIKEKDRLLELIRKEPKEEVHYISLIFLYTESGEEDKAFEIAELLAKQIPSSDWAQISLFKFYLDGNQPQEAIESMHKVFRSTSVDDKIKHRILNEFIFFVRKNPEYQEELTKVVQYFNDDREVKVAKEIGKFYQSKGDWKNAIRYYEVAVSQNREDIEAVLLLYQSYAADHQFNALIEKASESVESYPLQPEFYYFVGLGYNQIKSYKKAKDYLETGLDYLIDNKPLEANFMIQLGEASHGLGDAVKKEHYFQKAEKLLKEIGQ